MRRLLTVLLLIPSLAWADGVYDVGGYRITAHASLEGPALSLRGRVEGGRPCRVLKVTGVLQNVNSRTVTLTVPVENVGAGYGRILKSVDVDVGPLVTGWSVKAVYARCVEP